MSALRRLNADGIAQFASFVAAAREGGSPLVPTELLEDARTSQSVVPLVDVPDQVPATKRGVAEVLTAALKPLAGQELLKDRGIWSWLALKWFDRVCPETNGKRDVLQEQHYIPDEDYRRRYRHLLRTPYQIAQWAPDHNRLWLDAPVSSHGELMEQTVSRLFLLRVPAIREAMDTLYVNPETGKMKRGALGEAKPGNIRKRLPVRIQQLRRTFDLYAVDGEGLISLLGAEFQAWRQTVRR